jgi:hypothetical protein
MELSSRPSHQPPCIPKLLRWIWLAMAMMVVAEPKWPPKIDITSIGEVAPSDSRFKFGTHHIREVTRENNLGLRKRRLQMRQNLGLLCREF